MNNERYARHTILPQIGPEGQEKLCKASVLIVGVGGLGSPISLYLTAAGVGRIGLIDDDKVSLSNLQRQVLYQESEVGMLKVEQARKRLSALNRQTVIDVYPYRLTAQNARSILSPYDIVVDGSDNFATRYLVNDTAVGLGKPYVYGSIGAFHGQVSVFNYKGGADYRTLYPDESLLSGQANITLGVMGVVPGVIGCIQAAEVIKIVTGTGSVLRNKLWTIDLLTMEVVVLEL